MSRPYLLLTISCVASLASFAPSLQAASELNPASAESVAPQLSARAAAETRIRVTTDWGSPLEGGAGGKPSLIEATLGATGLRVGEVGDVLGVRTVAYGSQALGDAAPVETCVVPEDRADEVCSARLELDYGVVTEWWTPVPGGLEHGWTLHEAPEGAVTLELDIDGEVVSVDPDGAGVTLASAGGGRWRYDKLRAWDADGRPVATRLGAGEAGLLVQVDADGARWPITVDPLLSSEVKVVASDGATEDMFGVAVAGGGDVDGDLFADLVVGTALYGAPGRAYVYHGSSTGVDATTEQLIEASDGAADDSYGYSVATGGDINGDGYDDVVVGAYGANVSGAYSGAVYVYYGSAAGLDEASEQKISPPTGIAEDYFGISVSCAGDLDSDGYDDIVVGADGVDGFGPRSGAAYVIYGGAAGADEASLTRLEASDADKLDFFGYAVAMLGDVDGDGYDDLAVGAYGDEQMGPYSGSVYVYRGSSAGLDTGTEQKIVAIDGAADDIYGSAVAAAGDLDGDGYADLAVGAYGAAAYAGAVYVYEGSASGVDASSERKLTAADADADDSFGVSLAGGFDIDWDGYDDLVVGAYGDSEMAIYAGAMYVYNGSATGVHPGSVVKAVAGDASADDCFGSAVAGGDVDGDGYADVAVGAIGAAISGPYTGALYYNGGDLLAIAMAEVASAEVDADGDGYAASIDCDDTDSTVHPDATEVDNLIDEDCDGWVDEDFVFAGDLVITEINRQARIGTALTVNDGSWVEVYNTSARSVDLSNWMISSGSASPYNQVYIDPAAAPVVSPYGRVVFCDSSVYEGSAAAHPLTCDYVWGDPAEASTYAGTYHDNTLFLHRDNDEFALYVEGTRTTGLLVDSVRWTWSSTAGYWPRDSRFSMSLDPAYVDATLNDNRAAWCSTSSNAAGIPTYNTAWAWYDVPATSADEYGTPGADNYSCLTTRDVDGDGVTNATDCDDADAAVGASSTWYLDADADGYGTLDATVSACTQPAGYSADATDCDDTAPAVHPGAIEVCDGIDNDCNTVVDDGGLSGSLVYFADADSDGYGDPDVFQASCTLPSGYTDNDADCDDADPGISPDGVELDNLVDDDCDDWVDEDYVAVGDLVITEINRQARLGGTSTDNDGSWVEVQNTSSRWVDLSNWVIARGASSPYNAVYLDPSQAPLLGPGEAAVFCDSATYQASAGAAWPLHCDYVWGDSSEAAGYVGEQHDNTFYLRRDNDEFSLYVGGSRTTGTRIDTVHWTFDATDGYWPRNSRFSMTLDPAQVDATLNDSPSVWCSTTGNAADTVSNNVAWRWYDVPSTANDEYGTPGATNYDCPGVL